MATRTLIRHGGLPAVVAALLALLPTVAFASAPPLRAPVGALGAPSCADPGPCADLEVEIRQVDEEGNPVGGPLAAGDTVRYEVRAWNVGGATALDVSIEVVLAQSIGWSIDAPAALGCTGGADPEGPTTFRCDFGALAPGTIDTAVALFVVGTTGVDDCGEVPTTAVAAASNDGGEPAMAEATLVIECPPPTLTLAKSADVAAVAITGPSSAPITTPSVVTWTLAYTVTGAGASNVAISDPLPPGLVFLDASDGGILVDGVVHWTLPSVTASGAVTLRTTVDPETISRVAPTTNVAVIDSDETDPEQGGASISVTVDAPPLGGNPPVGPPAAPPGGASSGGTPPQGPAGPAVVPNTAMPAPAADAEPATWLGAVTIAAAGVLLVAQRRRPERSS